jgi:hypothetical protein
VHSINKHWHIINDARSALSERALSPAHVSQGQSMLLGSVQHD